MTEGMKAFAKRYHRSLDDPKLRDLYELDRSARRDQAAIAYTAEMKGETNVYEKVVRGMLQQGLSADLIYNCIDIPCVQVDAIISKYRAGNHA